MRPPEFIETDRLVLRVPTLSDAGAIFSAYSQDAQVMRYLNSRPHTSIRQAELLVAQCMVAWEGTERFPFAIVLKAEAKLVGMIAVRLEGFKAEIGFVLARPYWGQGLMTEAARHVVDWALRQKEIYRVWAVCDVDNRASARVLEKVGMQHEGIWRRYVIHPNISDKPRDCHSYAIVK